MTHLCLTLHQPDDQALDVPTVITDCQRWLATYQSVSIGVSTCTAPALVSALAALPRLQLVTVEPNGVAFARRAIVAAVAAGLPRTASVQLTDFDRMVTWTQVAPEELAALAQGLPPNTYQILGRTPAAFASHPREWRETEVLTNRVAAAYFDLPDLDITAGAARFSAALIPTLLTSKARLNDAEWPRLARAAGAHITYRACAGLAYVAATNRSHLPDPARELTARLRLAATITQSLYPV